MVNCGLKRFSIVSQSRQNIFKFKGQKINRQRNLNAGFNHLSNLLLVRIFCTSYKQTLQITGKEDKSTAAGFRAAL